MRHDHLQLRKPPNIVHASHTRYHAEAFQVANQIPLHLSDPGADSGFFEPLVAAINKQVHSAATCPSMHTCISQKSPGHLHCKSGAFCSVGRSCVTCASCRRLPLQAQQDMSHLPHLVVAALAISTVPGAMFSPHPHAQVNPPWPEFDHSPTTPPLYVPTTGLARTHPCRLDVVAVCCRHLALDFCCRLLAAPPRTLPCCGCATSPSDRIARSPASCVAASS